MLDADPARWNPLLVVEEHFVKTIASLMSQRYLIPGFFRSHPGACKTLKCVGSFCIDASKIDFIHKIRDIRGKDRTVLQFMR